MATHVSYICDACGNNVPSKYDLTNVVVIRDAKPVSSGYYGDRRVHWRGERLFASDEICEECVDNMIMSIGVVEDLNRIEAKRD